MRITNRLTAFLVVLTGLSTVLTVVAVAAALLPGPFG